MSHGPRDANMVAYSNKEISKYYFVATDIPETYDSADSTMFLMRISLNITLTLILKSTLAHSTIHAGIIMNHNHLFSDFHRQQKYPLLLFQSMV